VWFAPTRFSRFSSKLPNANAPESEDEILRSVKTVVELIDELVTQGIPAKRIVVGGFGQGAAIAVLTSIVSKYSGQLGGVIGQCGYLPLRERISALRERQGLPKTFVPVQMVLSCAMADPYLPRAEFSAQVHKLKELGYTDATVKIAMFPELSCLDAAMNPLPLKETLEFLGRVVPRIEGGEEVQGESKNLQGKQMVGIKNEGLTGGNVQQKQKKQVEERGRLQKTNLQSNQKEDKKKTSSRSIRRIFGRAFGSRNQEGSST
jgi:predicted esterase